MNMGQPTATTLAHYTAPHGPSVDALMSNLTSSKTAVAVSLVWHKGHRRNSARSVRRCLVYAVNDALLYHSVPQYLKHP